MKKLLACALAALMLASLISGCKKGGGTTDATVKASQEASNKATEAPTEAEKKGSEEIRVGNFDTEGYSLVAEAGTFFEGASVKVTPVSGDELAKYENAEKYEIVGAPVKLHSDDYNGAIFGTDVTLTLPILSRDSDPDDRVDTYFFLYWDEATGDIRYMEPDSIDLEARTMSIKLPHFSFFGSGKLSDKEQIEMFLDRYASKEAVARSNSKQAAEALEPYLKAKTDALNLTKEAQKELVAAIVNEFGGALGDTAGEATDLATSAYKSLDKGSPEDFNDKVNEILSGKCVDILEKMGKGGKAAMLFKDAGKTGKIAGALAGGDYKEAAKNLGEIMADTVPGGTIAMKAVGYVGATVTESFTNWKSNKVEELYQLYKNGGEDVWHNEVIAGDEESLKRYIHTSSGFTLAKGVYRFYNMDKAAETCEKFGWGKKDYEELDQHYRDEFDRRAEEGLMNYFRTRLAQEKEAEKIKAEERVCIEEMLNPYYGVLTAGNFNKFFGENSREDYSLTDRLERLVKVRRFISTYVDEEALKKSTKDGVYNYGTLLNDWVGLASENRKSEAIDKFIELLRDYGLLNPAYSDYVSLDELCGEYSGAVSLIALRTSQQAYEAYIAENGDGDFGSRAECDQALSAMIDESGVSAGSSIIVRKSESDASKCTVTAYLISSDEDGGTEAHPAVSSASFDGEKLTVSNAEGTTVLDVSKNEDGAVCLKGDKVTFNLSSEEEGDSMIFLLDVSVDVVKN